MRTRSATVELSRRLRRAGIGFRLVDSFAIGRVPDRPGPSGRAATRAEARGDRLGSFWKASRRRQSGSFWKIGSHWVRFGSPDGEVVGFVLEDRATDRVRFGSPDSEPTGFVLEGRAADWVRFGGPAASRLGSFWEGRRGIWVRFGSPDDEVVGFVLEGRSGLRPSGPNSRSTKLERSIGFGFVGRTGGPAHEPLASPRDHGRRPVAPPG